MDRSQSWQGARGRPIDYLREEDSKKGIITIIAIIVVVTATTTTTIIKCTPPSPSSLSTSSPSLSPPLSSSSLSSTPHRYHHHHHTITTLIIITIIASSYHYHQLSSPPASLLPSHRPKWSGLITMWLGTRKPLILSSTNWSVELTRCSHLHRSLAYHSTPHHLRSPPGVTYDPVLQVWAQEPLAIQASGNKGQDAHTHIIIKI